MSAADRRAGGRGHASALRLCLLSIPILGAVLVTAPAPSAAAADVDAAASGDAVRGAVVYQVCMACHSLDENDVGPRHRGVLGRAAGAVDGYAYSPALKASGIVWSKETLDRWLRDPQALVPGTKMFFALSNPQDRADVIAYLEGQR